MNGYAMELMGAERLRELRHEASGGRRIGTAARQRETARAWRARLSLHVVGRLARLSGPASSG